MTTDELLLSLPPCIGNHIENGCFVLARPDDDIKWLSLNIDGKDWCASYGIEGDFLCMGMLENGLYDNAFAFGKTPNEALQGLYEWCVKHNFIKEK